MRAHVMRLEDSLGARDFDDLYRFSIEQPDAYWAQVTKILGIVWAWRLDAGTMLVGSAPRGSRTFISGSGNQG
ncbi:MAG TPA: hypothetical protein VJ770_14060 [Stellaceae bacterium]|nr:hypothetical protein [Stellaceae bacterium]